jgi:hypothetical protein
MTVSINGTTGLTFNDASTQATAATGFGFKNRIINGAMQISQRNGTSSVTPTNAEYTLDRWKAFNSQSSKFTVQQDAGGVTPPAGFTDYLGITSTASTTVGAGDFFFIDQRIEGFNVSDLGFGTANAQPITISFWVRSSLTGTFTGGLVNSANSRGYGFTYVISATNTWEQKSVTIAGDTTGTWLTNNGVGLTLIFGFGCGATFTTPTNGSWQGGNYFAGGSGGTSVVGTNGATFYITGVQLEKGSTATSFDYRPYGTELLLCQRYCEVVKPSGATNYANLAVGQCISTTGASAVYFYQVAKRSQPTVTYSSANTFSVTSSTGPDIVCTTVNTDRSDVTALSINIVVASGLSAGNATRLLQNNTATPQITISSEL